MEIQFNARGRLTVGDGAWALGTGHEWGLRPPETFYGVLVPST